LRDRGGRQFEPVNRCEKIYYKSRFLGHFFSDGKKKKKKKCRRRRKEKGKRYIDSDWYTPTEAAHRLSFQLGPYIFYPTGIYEIRSVQMAPDSGQNLFFIRYHFPMENIRKNKNNIKGMSSIV
jgi:hypothetical protein